MTQFRVRMAGHANWRIIATAMSVNVRWDSTAPTARTYKLAKQAIKLRLNRQDWPLIVHNSSDCINCIVFKTKSVNLSNVAPTSLIITFYLILIMHVLSGDV